MSRLHLSAQSDAQRTSWLLLGGAAPDHTADKPWQEPMVEHRDKVKPHVVENGGSCEFLEGSQESVSASKEHGVFKANLNAPKSPTIPSPTISK